MTREQIRNGIMQEATLLVNRAIEAAAAGQERSDDDVMLKGLMEQVDALAEAK